jgi:hypothetical protein
MASGAWYSPDGGLNWHSAGLDNVVIYDMKASWFTGAIYYDDGTIDTSTVELFAATEDGFYRTANGGQDWELIELEQPAGTVSFTTRCVSPSKINQYDVFVVVDATIGIEDFVLLYRVNFEDYDTNGYPLFSYWTYAAAAANDWDDVLGQDIAPDETRAITTNPAGTIVYCTIGPNILGEYAIYERVGAGLPSLIGTFNGEVRTMTMNAAGTILFVGGYFTTVDPGGGPIAADAVAQYVVATTTWSQVGAVVWPGASPNGRVNQLVWGSDGNLYATGWFNLLGHVAYWDGFNWSQLGGGLGDEGRAIVCDSTCTNIFVGGLFRTVEGGVVNARRVAVYRGAAWGPLGGGLNSTCFALAITPDDRYVICGGDFDSPGSCIAKWDDNLSKWEQMGLGIGYGELIATSVLSITIDGLGRIWVGGTYTKAGAETANNISYYLDGWNVIGEYPNTGTDGNTIYEVHYNETTHEVFIVGDFTTVGGDAGEKCRRKFASYANYVLAAEGYSVLVDSDTGGNYIFLGVLDGSNNPVILRISQDMYNGILSEILYSPGAGTWGGPTCDWNYPDIVWFYGDFGNVKIVGSEDFGDTLADFTDGTWGAGELVRPLMVSSFDPFDIVAVLNVAGETWRSFDAAYNWTQIGGATPFNAQCGVRDWFNHDTAYIGGNVANADNVELSIYTGDTWLDRSIPIVANISSIIIL